MVDALELLASWDHVYVTVEGVAAVCKALNVPVPAPQVQRVSPPGTVRGFYAWDDDGEPLPAGTPVEGYDAAALAQVICRSLGVQVMQWHGRGKQLRACVEALRSHFARH